MEVEEQDREQVDSERERRGTRDRGRRQNNETTNAQTRDDMWMKRSFVQTRRATPGAMQVHERKDEVCKCTRKMRCMRVYLSTPPVGYSGSLSTVNETNCNKKREQKKL